MFTAEMSWLMFGDSGIVVRTNQNTSTPYGQNVALVRVEVDDIND